MFLVSIVAEEGKLQLGLCSESVSGSYLISPADSYNVTSYDCCEKMLSYCEEMHTIAKESKTIVTEIKTIARPGEIIASICRTMFFVVVVVLVQ